MNLMPVNLEEEKKKFLFDIDYNPQFVYEQPVSDEVLYKRFGVFEGELFSRAQSIMDAVIKKWGDESSYLNEVEGEILTKEETISIISDYLAKTGLQDLVKIQFSSKYIPRTHIDGYTMHIRVPIEYRRKSFIGTLHHEIGTHVIRRYNEERQIWHNRRKDFSLDHYLETEEGLAVLHSYFESEFPYMWINSVQYYACTIASKSSFSQVYKSLKNYIDDRERKFKIALRAKRGITDTSLPGGYTKDQVYLRGVVKISQWLKKNDFDISSLYRGKLSIEDLPKVSTIKSDEPLLLPSFFTNSREEYKKIITHILKTNGF